MINLHSTNKKQIRSSSGSTHLVLLEAEIVVCSGLVVEQRDEVRIGIAGAVRRRRRRCFGSRRRLVRTRRRSRQGDRLSSAATHLISSSAAAYGSSSAVQSGARAAGVGRLLCYQVSGCGGGGGRSPRRRGCGRRRTATATTTTRRGGTGAEGQSHHHHAASQTRSPVLAEALTAPPAADRPAGWVIKHTDSSSSPASIRGASADIDTVGRRGTRHPLELWSAVP